MEEAEAFLAAWAVAADDRARVMIILDEVASNIIKNAWVDGLEHCFTIELEVHEAALGLDLRLRTTDDGHAFDPTKAAPPNLDLSLEDRQPGGLGLFMVKEMSDAMHYARTGGLNCLTVAKRLARAR